MMTKEELARRIELGETMVKNQTGIYLDQNYYLNVLRSHLALYDKMEMLEKAITLIRTYFSLLDNLSPIEHINQTAIKLNTVLAELGVK